MTHHSDLLIIGAGILGLSHAYAAANLVFVDDAQVPIGLSIFTFFPRIPRTILADQRFRAHVIIG